MSLALILVGTAGVLLAYFNGANDVSKGIATLVGSGVTTYRRAILWGTFCTGLGGGVGALAANAMVVTFGNGLLAKETAPTFVAALSTILGATAWVAVATLRGMPVSTTHAMVGSIAGVGAVAYGLAGVNWGVLSGSLALPLLLSPVAALLLTSAIVGALRVVGGTFEADADCLCAQCELAPTVAAVRFDGSAAAVTSIPQLRFAVGSAEACATEQPRALKLSVARLHWISSGAVSFARGMNDAPKIVAILLAAALLQADMALQPSVFYVVTLGMMVGGLAGQRVTTVLAEKVTPMNHWRGFLANVVTAVLVAPGAALGFPMSTTHVSSGAIIGIGLQRPWAVNWKTVREVALAWLVTVPCASLFGVLIYFVVLRLFPLA